MKAIHQQQPCSRFDSAKAFQARQSGAVLITSLLLLLVMTMFALSSMNSSTMQEKMAANAQYDNSAFQAAEAAGVSGMETPRLKEVDEFKPVGDEEELEFEADDSEILASSVVSYVGEKPIRDSDMDGDEGGVDGGNVKASRYEIVSEAQMDSGQAYVRIRQGVDYD
jgi:type IV pilus assembly protein PilX